TACNSDIKCVEAYSTAVANYYRFRTHASATEYEATVDDGFSVNYFVVAFAGKDASVDDQLFVMHILAGMWNDYEGDFPPADRSLGARLEASQGSASMRYCSSAARRRRMAFGPTP
ncbi:hypothetical protein, partial [Arthrobacter agilis]|uniref:hypothetical protein n=1 Tax=Arthrobacter agilis TaxID=37921 RepID=UPI001ABF9EBA